MGGKPHYHSRQGGCYIVGEVDATAPKGKVYKGDLCRRKPRTSDRLYLACSSHALNRFPLRPLRAPPSSQLSIRVRLVADTNCYALGGQHWTCPLRRLLRAISWRASKTLKSGLENYYMSTM